MFKKGCPINQRSLLSGADRKKIRRGLEKQFELLGEEGLDHVLPNKAGEMEVAKVHGTMGGRTEGAIQGGADATQEEMNAT